MDYLVINVDRLSVAPEAANFAACVAEAARNGINAAEAELCDTTNKGCKACPFRAPMRQNENA